MEIYDSWSHLTAEEEQDKDMVLQAFTNHFEPKANFQLSRFQLREMFPKPHEPVSYLVTRLKIQAKKCNFGDQPAIEDNLIDQVVKGVAHTQVQKQLSDHNPHTLTLDRCEQYARTYESTQEQLRQLGHTSQMIDSIRRKQRNRGRVGRIRQTPSQRYCSYCGGAPHRERIAQLVVSNVTYVTSLDIGEKYVNPRKKTPPSPLSGMRGDPQQTRPSQQGIPHVDAAVTEAKAANSMQYNGMSKAIRKAQPHLNHLIA